MASSRRLSTAKKFLDQFATFDRPTLDSILAEDYVHHFAPSSLAPFSLPTKQAFLAHHGSMSGIMSGLPLTAKEYIDSDSSDKVVVWATGRAHFRDEVKDDGGGIPVEEDWMYEGEYVFILSMDRTGEKVVRGVEFLDGKATLDKLLGLMKRAQANSEKKSGVEWWRRDEGLARKSPDHMKPANLLAWFLARSRYGHVFAI